jgi:hypothetical protein
MMMMMMITHSDDDDDDTDRCGEEVGHEWHTHHWSKR